MGITITIASLSGGQGKTTISFFLSKYLATRGKILACDIDPQANLSFFLGYDLETTEASAYELITGEVEPKHCIYWSHDNAQLHIIPTDEGLAKAQEFLAASGMGALVLKSRIAQIKDQFEFIIIDSPPSRTQLALTTLGAADVVIIPVETHVKGINSLLRTLELLDGLKTLGQVTPKILGVVPFRDRWIGRIQQKQSRDAIAIMREIALERGFTIFNSLIESERYKQAIDKGVLLDALGYPELMIPFQQIEVALCQIQH
jgi:chromosome partitioning protein